MRQLHRSTQLAMLLLQGEPAARELFGADPLPGGHFVIFRGIRSNLHRHDVDGLRFVVESKWGKWGRNHSDWTYSHYFRQRPVLSRFDCSCSTSDDCVAGFLSAFEETNLGKG
jgi:hypothetical protein